jgi:hypothetical protein
MPGRRAVAVEGRGEPTPEPELRDDGGGGMREENYVITSLVRCPSGRYTNSNTQKFHGNKSVKKREIASKQALLCVAHTSSTDERERRRSLPPTNARNSAIPTA